MFQPHAANRSIAPSKRRVSVRYTNRNRPITIANGNTHNSDGRP